MFLCYNEIITLKWHLILYLLVQIEALQSEAAAVGELYELINRFRVATPPEDFAVYQVRLSRPPLNIIKSSSE